MAIVVLLEVKAKQGTGDQLVAMFKAILPDTRARDGFLDIVVHQSQDDKDNLVLVEKWETKDHYESYLGWRQETGVLDQLVAACEGPPSIRYYDITDA
ncbi:MAG TPA: antibiotic biosynthesis monooxygenase [Gemmatimonadetes bacterium]|nr:antibiotic biosynthesis monooxygenase [Gemmatimonadota bacterium]